MCKAARLHVIGYLYQRFMDSVARAPEELKPIISLLCELFGLLKIQENIGSFLQYSCFQPKDLPLIEQRILVLYAELRPNIIPLVDSFNLSDFILNSSLGAFDGDIYQRYFSHILSRNPPKKPSYFDSLLLPLFEQTFAEADRQVLDDDAKSHL